MTDTNACVFVLDWFKHESGRPPALVHRTAYADPDDAEKAADKFWASYDRTVYVRPGQTPPRACQTDVFTLEAVRAHPGLVVHPEHSSYEVDVTGRRTFVLIRRVEAVPEVPRKARRREFLKHLPDLVAELEGELVKLVPRGSPEASAVLLKVQTGLKIIRVRAQELQVKETV